MPARIIVPRHFRGAYGHAFGRSCVPSSFVGTSALSLPPAVVRGRWRRRLPRPPFRFFSTAAYPVSTTGCQHDRSFHPRHDSGGKASRVAALIPGAKLIAISANPYTLGQG